VHLRVHSQYSLLEGAIRVKQIPDLCKTANTPAVAVTDSGNLFGALEFSMACANNGIQPIIGVEANLLADDGKTYKLPIYAKNAVGYQNLLKLVSDSFMVAEDSHNPTITFDDLAKYKDGLLVLSGGNLGYINRSIALNQVDTAIEYIQKLHELLAENFYIEIQREGTEEELTTEPILVEQAHKLGIPLIATNTTYFVDKQMHEAHDALMCIAEAKYLVDEDRRKVSEECYFKSADEMCELFKDMPEAIENTLNFAKRCSIISPKREPILPNFEVESGSQEEELKLQSIKGLEERLKPLNINDSTPYFDRLDFELEVINKMGFPGYFLIVSDFIKWAKQQNIPVGPGRGSGAGSIVAWALQITDLDPLEHGLLFERFLNPERISMPDFDIDFCQERREEVIQYVRRKYGADKVAQIITFGKLQAKAVLRDVGRVMQMPYVQVDKITKMIPFNPVDPITLSKALELDPALRKEREEDEQIDKLIEIGLQLEGLNRHCSTHAAGLVIADRPLDELVPMYNDPRSDIPVIQFNMKDAESAGLVKFDFLGLKTLTQIDKALQYINANGNDLELPEIPIDDAPTFEMLSKGDTIGVFQLDSSLVRDAIRKMRPDKFGDIVALTSLCRPGPMENIPVYVDVKHGRKEPEYPHKKLEEMLSETYGIMVYQEQVMQAGQILSGYTLGGADLLRRAMGKKIKAEMDKQRQMFVDGAAEHSNVSKKDADEIFDTIAKFAGYGFNKSHAAAYGLIAYHTAYLRCHYITEFLTATMNMDIGDTDKLNFFSNEAKREGVTIQMPDINKGDIAFMADPPNKTIIYGLSGIKNVSDNAVQEIVAERNKNGEYKDIFDFAKRISAKNLNKKTIEYLAKSGAFSSIHDNPAQLVQSIEVLSNFSRLVEEERESDQISIFGGGDVEVPLPKLAANIAQWNDKQALQAEYEALGFYLSSHPLDAYEEWLERNGVTQSDKLDDAMENGEPNKRGEIELHMAGVVSTKTLRGGKKGRFGFLKLTDKAGMYEVVMYDEELITNASELMDSNKPLHITIDARKDEGGIRMVARQIVELDAKVQEGARYIPQATQYQLNIAGAFNAGGLANLLASNDNSFFDLAEFKINLRAQGKRITIDLGKKFKVNKKIMEKVEEFGELNKCN